MTRETKVGLVVAGSFLCLVGVVVASRLSRKPVDNNALAENHETIVPQSEVPKAEKPPEHKPTDEHTKHSADGPQVAVTTKGSNTPVLPPLPPAGDGFQPLIPPGLVAPLAKPPELPPMVAANTPEKTGKKDSGGLDFGKVGDNHEKIKGELEKNAAKLAHEQTKAIGKPADDGGPLANSGGKIPDFPPPNPDLLAKTNDLLPISPGARPSEVPLVEPSKGARKEEPLPSSLPPSMELPGAMKFAQAGRDPNSLSPLPSAPVGPPVSKKESGPPPPTGPLAFNNAKELTNPGLAPMGKEPNTLPSPAAMPALNLRPTSQVLDAPVETYFCKPEDRSFDDISRRFYGDPKYARALQEFNKESPLARDNVKMSNPLLSPNQQVFVPATKDLLERKYPTLIDNRIATMPPAPVIGISAPLNSNIATVGRATNTVIASSDPTKTYRVQGQGQFLAEIAQQYLGDQRRWSEIYRLNSNLRPEAPIPGGTEIRLPANANLP